MRRGFVDVDEDERVAAGREGAAIVGAGFGRGRGRGREIKRETDSGREGEGAIVAGPGMEEDLDFLSSMPGASGRRSWAGVGVSGVAEALGTYKAISQRDGVAEDGGAGEGWGGGMGGPRRVPGGRDQMGVNVNEGGGGAVHRMGLEPGVSDELAKSMSGQHTQEALVHLDELKLREIAQERAMHISMNLSTTKRIAETHRNR